MKFKKDNLTLIPVGGSEQIGMNANLYQFNEKWILITSASHMKRALLIAENQNWNITPYAVDFKTIKKFNTKLNFQLLSNLNLFNEASHEWLGLISYYLMGRTSKIF